MPLPFIFNAPSVQMRTPAEAQSRVMTEGRLSRTPNLPSQTWKHENSALINDSINYDIKVRWPHLLGVWSRKVGMFF